MVFLLFLCLVGIVELAHLCLSNLPRSTNQTRVTAPSASEIEALLVRMFPLTSPNFSSTVNSAVTTGTHLFTYLPPGGHYIAVCHSLAGQYDSRHKYALTRFVVV